MNIKQAMIKAFEITKLITPGDVDKTEWYETCDKAIEHIQSKKSDEVKINLKDLEQANLLIKNIKISELLAKSEIQSINVKYPDKINDRVYLSEKLENLIKKAMQDCAEESKAELKDLGVDYE
ncbi:hypothetical protein [Streptococcus sp. FT1-55]|uniref:hypothetical protein n=1 Tax=Streptococcus sp. FT1-55 TaxID=3409805 RepID=UPI003BF49F20